MKLCTVDGCAKRHEAKGFCQMHYVRFKRCGSPGSAEPKIAERGAPFQWIKDHATYDGDECLIWPFPRNADGYGQVVVGGVHRTAQSMMCEVAHGPAPFANADAAHSCGRGHEGCLAPNHLRWATRQENCDDAVAQGRTTRGEKNRHAKLTEGQALAIYSEAGADTEVALRYGVSRETIRRIRAGETWKHVTEARRAA